MTAKTSRQTSLWTRVAEWSAKPELMTILFFVVVVPLAAYFMVRYGVFRIHSPTVDFPSFYYGAKAAFELHKSPYGVTIWKAMQELYPQARLYPYLYPPPSLVFFYPLSLLDYQSAYLVMLALNNLLALIVPFVLLFPVMRLRTSSLLALVLAAYLFWFFPLISTIKTGQINLLVLLSILLAWYAMKRSLGPLWIAVPLAIGVLLKLYPVLFIPVLFFRKEYKALAALGIILVLASLLATWVLPAGIWMDWYKHVAANGYSTMVNGMAVGTAGNQSLNGFLVRLFFGGPRKIEALVTAPTVVTHIVPYLATGLVLLVSLVVTYLERRDSSAELLDLQFSLWSLVLYLVAPLSWDHLLVLILPCLFLAAQRAVVRRDIVLGVVVALVAVLLAWDFPYAARSLRQGPATLLISAKFLAVVAMWVYYVVLNLRHGLQHPRPTSTGQSTPAADASASEA